MRFFLLELHGQVLKLGKGTSEASSPHTKLPRSANQAHVGRTSDKQNEHHVTEHFMTAKEHASILIWEHLPTQLNSLSMCIYIKSISCHHMTCHG